MSPPFSETAFLDVFGAYNQALWPVVVGFWLVTTGLVVQWWRRGGASRSWLVLLAVHWAWSGVVYHGMFFRPINPVAVLFAGLFVVEAALLTWLAVVARGKFDAPRTPRGVLARGLVVYALGYPFLGLAFNLDYPRLPLFAVPCPTTLLTAGVLLTTSGVPRLVNIVPVIWAVIGSAAAFVLRIQADLMLVVAGAVLALDTVAPRALGPRAEG